MALVSALPMNPLAPRIITFNVTESHPPRHEHVARWQSKTPDARRINRPLLHSPDTSMKPLVWSFLFIGVGLNAAAQLLLKGATRTSGPLSTRRRPDRMVQCHVVATDAAALGRPCLLWREPDFVAGSAVATASERYLPDAFSGIRRQCRRGRLSLRRGTDDAKDHRHCAYLSGRRRALPNDLATNPPDHQARRESESPSGRPRQRSWAQR